MNRKRDRTPKIVVFLFLTALVALIFARIVLKSGEVRGEKVLEEQFRYFERLISNSPQKLKRAEIKDLEKNIFSHLGSSFMLPEASFAYFAIHRAKSKRVKGAFVPFLFDNDLYLLGIYSLGRDTAGKKEDFLDAATLLSGNREGVSFVVFETEGNLKVSLMSRVSVEELFLLTRNYFMER